MDYTNVTSTEDKLTEQRTISNDVLPMAERNYKDRDMPTFERIYVVYHKDSRKPKDFEFTVSCQSSCG